MKQILIVDDVEDIREILAVYILNQIEANIFQAESGQEALDIFKNHPQIDLIISDYNMPNGNGGFLYKKIRESSQVPFILHTTEPPNRYPDFKEATNFTHVSKPILRESFFKVLHEILSGDAKAVRRPKYVPVSLNLLKKSVILPGDIFVRLGTDNFVKIAHQGNTLVKDDFNKYANKNIKHFYIEPKASLQMMAQLHDILNLTDVDNTQALQMTSATVDFLMNAKEELGFSKEVQDLTNKNINKVLKLAESSPQISTLLKKWNFDENSEFADRCTMIALISTTIAKRLNWVSDKTADKLAFAALLHDISLDLHQISQLRELLEKVGDKKFQKSPEGKAFLHHPLKAAEILQKWPQSPPDVDTIVAQHHEKPDSSGFPHGLNHMRISPLSAVFIVAQDLADYIVTKKGSGSIQDWIKLKKDYYIRGEFKKIIETIAENTN